MNYFIEGLQGSGKSTALRKITEKYDSLTPIHEGDYSPVELAWCAYTTEEEYSSILRRFAPIRRSIEAKTVSEDDRRIISYTQVQTDIPDFYQTLEQYEIYNGRKPLDEFREIVLRRYSRWTGDNMVFECSLFQNIIDSVSSAYVGSFVGIHHKGRGAVLCRLTDQHLRVNQCRFQMKMRVNKPGSYILTFQVDFFFALKISDSHDDPVFDGDVAFLHAIGEHIDDLGVFQHQIRLFKLACSSRASHVFL